MPIATRYRSQRESHMKFIREPYDAEWTLLYAAALRTNKSRELTIRNIERLLQANGDVRNTQNTHWSQWEINWSPHTHSKWLIVLRSPFMTEFICFSPLQLEEITQFVFTQFSEHSASRNWRWERTGSRSLTMMSPVDWIHRFFRTTVCVWLSSRHDSGLAVVR